MTDSDRFALDLTAGFQRQDEDEDGRRRWVGPDGTYVLVETTDPPEGTSDSQEAANMVMARTLGAYRLQHEGLVELVGAVPVPGADEARAARLKFETATGELANALVVVAGTASQVVLLHIVWSAIGSEEMVASALRVAESLRLTA